MSAVSRHLLFNSNVVKRKSALVMVGQGVSTNCPNLFLSELCQISTKFDNFWYAYSQDDRIMYGTLTVYRT